ncbi:phosphatase [Marinilabiliaceae bacterium JC017]|nr:phosphatase [Marinilabiliaceae bacterium JC017]
MTDIEKIFSEMGGQFITPFSFLKEKVKKVKAIIFDWDGVFNNGSKATDMGSPFAEPDAMGMNMFKLDYWLRNKQFPLTFIVTGENNKLGLNLARREHMNAVFLNYKNKTKALEFLCESYHITPEEIAFVYDDILDIDVARKVGVSLLIDRSGSPLMKQYLIDNKICDYITGNPGGQCAVREVCELLIGANGDMNNTIETRVKFVGDYEHYLRDRDQIETRLFEFQK